MNNDRIIFTLPAATKKALINIATDSGHTASFTLRNLVNDYVTTNTRRTNGNRTRTEKNVTKSRTRRDSRNN